MRRFKSIRLIVVSLSVLITVISDLCAANRVEIRREGRKALTQLYSVSPAARRLGESARAVLVFPSIVNAGSNIGKQRGCGVLFAHGSVIGYYKSTAVSSSVPKGVEKFGCALFFMSEDDLGYLRKSGGWEVEAGPSVVVREKQKRKRQLSASGNGSVNQVVTITPSTARIVGDPSQVTRRTAMNDQQEAAPRPNDLTLDPMYRGYVPIPTTDPTGTVSTTTPRKGVYAFAFGRRGLISGLCLQRTKITPISPE